MCSWQRISPFHCLPLCPTVSLLCRTIPSNCVRSQLFFVCFLSDQRPTQKTLSYDNTVTSTLGFILCNSMVSYWTVLYLIQSILN